jgi:hypothetical protein
MARSLAQRPAKRRITRWSARFSPADAVGERSLNLERIRSCLNAYGTGMLHSLGLIDLALCLSCAPDLEWYGWAVVNTDCIVSQPRSITTAAPPLRDRCATATLLGL